MEAVPSVYREGDPATLRWRVKPVVAGGAVLWTLVALHYFVRPRGCNMKLSESERFSTCAR